MRHLKISCDKCTSLFKTKKELKNHICNYYNFYKPSIEEQITKVKHTFESTHHEINQQNIFSKKSIDIFTNILSNIVERRKALNITCINCKKVCTDTDLRSTTCSNSHIVCITCFDDIEDSCPICNMEVDVNTCYICLSNKMNIVPTGCDHTHECCQSCLDSIKTIHSICPFCRGPI